MADAQKVLARKLVEHEAIQRSAIQLEHQIRGIAEVLGMRLEQVNEALQDRSSDLAKAVVEARKEAEK